MSQVRVWPSGQDSEVQRFPEGECRFCMVAALHERTKGVGQMACLIQKHEEIEMPSFL